MKKNYIKIISGVTLAIGMAGLVVLPVGASTFNDANDTLTLEETVANGAGYEWGLSAVDGGKFMASLNANKKITIENATKENLIKNLTATQKFFDDAKAEGPAGVAKFEAFKTAMQKMSKLAIEGTEDLLLDDELVAKMSAVIVDNEMINQTEGISSFELDFPGKNIDMTKLSDASFDGLFGKVKLKLIRAEKVKATPHIAKKIKAMDAASVAAGQPPIVDPDKIEYVKPDMNLLKNKITEGENKVEENKDNEKVKEEVEELKMAIMKAKEVVNDDYADENDRDEAGKKIDEKIRKIDDKNDIKAPNTGAGREDNTSGSIVALLSGATLLTVVGLVIRKKA